MWLVGRVNCLLSLCRWSLLFAKQLGRDKSRFIFYLSFHCRRRQRAIELAELVRLCERNDLAL